MAFLGVDVDPGETTRIRVPIASYVDSSPITVPVQITRGREVGPVLYVQGGMHGDEMTGIEVCRLFLEAVPGLDFRGTVVGVPVANVPSHLTRSRGFENEERRLMDLNRIFPGTDEGLLSERIAHILMTEFVRHADLTVDLHSALAGCTIAPFTYVDPADDAGGTLEVREIAAQAFGTPYIYYKARGAKLGTSDLSRSLAAQADAAGYPVVLAEMGESLRVSREFVRMGTLGLINVMRCLGMVDGDAPSQVAQRRFSTIHVVHVNTGGGLRMEVSLGDEVGAGQRVGTVVDVFGRPVEVLNAPAQGFVLRLMLTGAVGTGAEAAWIAS